MRKNADRVLIAALFAAFLLYTPYLVFGAEYTGTITNDQSQLDGNVNLESTANYPNGKTCTEDSECASGHCASDYDGSGKWCASAGSCAHDGTLYADGTSVCYGNYKETCSSGVWVATLCSYGCSNGACLQAGAVGGGAAGGGGGGGAGPTPTPTPTPYEEEIISESTYTYTPTPDQVEELFKEAGITDENTINTAKQLAEELQFERKLTIKKRTNIQTGEESFVSTFTIQVYNPTNKIYENISVVEEIPKAVARSASEIESLAQFEVLVEDPVIKFIVSRLEPNQSIVIDYTVNKKVDENTLQQFNSAIFAEKITKAPLAFTFYIVDEEGNRITTEAYVSIECSNKEASFSKSIVTSAGIVETMVPENCGDVIATIEAEGYSKITVTVKDGESVTLSRIAPATPTPAPTVTPTAPPTASPTPKVTPPAQPSKLQWLLILVLLVLIGIAVYLLSRKWKERPPEEKKAAPPLMPKAPPKEKVEKKKEELKEKFKKREEHAAKKVEEKPKKRYVCEVCGREFKNKFALRGHMRHHEAEKKRKEKEAQKEEKPTAVPEPKEEPKQLERHAEELGKEEPIPAPEEGEGEALFKERPKREE
jgi:hypothetical protein